MFRERIKKKILKFYIVLPTFDFETLLTLSKFPLAKKIGQGGLFVVCFLCMAGGGEVKQWNF